MVKDKDILKEITPDDLPEPYRTYAAALGVEELYNVCQLFGGATIYIPKPDLLFQKWKQKCIKEEFNGYNAKELAWKYGVSDRTVQKLVEGKQIIMKGQVTLIP